MLWDHRPGQQPLRRHRAAGVLARASGGSSASARTIFEGTPLGFTEGAASLQARRLLLPDHGRGRHRLGPRRDHGAVARRSTGPYELHPDVHVLTARDRPDCRLQRAGHADLVETPDGETYMVYLCGRPLPNRGRCTLGRETAIQRMVWGDDGWLRTARRHGRPAARDARRRHCPRTRSRRRPGARRLRLRRSCRSTSSGCARRGPEELFSLTARPGIPAALRPRDRRQPVPAGARRTPAAGALLQRLDDGRVRAARISSRWPA